MSEPPREDHRTVTLLELNNYFRQERGMVRREARYYAREVYRNEVVSAHYLPAGWHESIWRSGTKRVKAAIGRDAGMHRMNEEELTRHILAVAKTYDLHLPLSKAYELAIVFADADEVVTEGQIVASIRRLMSEVPLVGNLQNRTKHRA